MTGNNARETQDPVSIAQYVLDVTDAAYTARDFDAFARCFDLPHIVGTFNGDRLLRTRDELARVFDAMCTHFDANHVIAMHRRVIEAQFIDDTTVQATFVSKHITKCHMIGEETVAHGILRLIEGNWKVSESRYASPDQSIANALHSFCRDTP